MRRTIDFPLHYWPTVESLCARPRFAEHPRETFGAMLGPDQGPVVIKI